MLTKNFPNRIRIRLDSASVRFAQRLARTSTEQLKLLDERLGFGAGAKRERAKLAQKEEKASE